MRRALVFSIIILASFMLMAEDLATSTFVVKAYKVGKPSGDGLSEFVITDAISDFSMLNRVSDGSELEIGDYLTSFLGDADAAQDFSSEKIIFSVRASGSGTGSSYRVEMTFDPFRNSSGGLSNLGAKYVLGHTSYVFTETNSNKCMVSGRWWNTHYTIEERAASSGGWNSTAFTPVNSIYVRDSASTLRFGWRFASSLSGSGSAVDSTDWIVRAAVSMTIDSDDYRNLTYDTHRADVTVTITAD